MNNEKKRLSIDVKKAVFLRIQREAIREASKPKLIVENYINTMYNTNKKAAAPKEVSAAAKPNFEVKIDKNGKEIYFLDGARISKVKFQELTK